MTWRTDVKALDVEIDHAITIVRDNLPDDARVRQAFVTIENFVAVALRVMATTNPSKIKAATKAVELQSLIPPGERRAPG